MKISMIAAVSYDNVIGKMNAIPWKYPEDFKFFKEMTLNSVIVMGRLTYESIGGRPLPKRRNIVLSSGKIDGVDAYSSLELAIEKLKAEGVSQVWLIGGAHLYSEGFKWADDFYITRIPVKIETLDNKEELRYFPKIDTDKFIEYRDWKTLPSTETQDKLEVVRYVKRCKKQLNCGHDCDFHIDHVATCDCLKSHCDKSITCSAGSFYKASKS